jgi:RimJ/RimL family protein N-acetyltransferase
MNLVLYSKRLALVPLDETDIDITVEMFTDPDVLRFAGGVMSEADIHRDMHVWTRRGGNGCIGIWCVSDRDSGEKFGSAALLPMPVEGDDTDFDLVVPGQMPEGDVEVGYFLKRSAWGKGYATEACKRILRMAFEYSPLTEVVATFEKGNSACPNFRITRDEWVRMQRSGRAT